MKWRAGRTQGAIGALLLLSCALAALSCGLLDEHAPLAKDVASGLDAFGMPRPPSLAYPLGTDALGRCLAARLAHGALLSLVVAGVATTISLLLGALVGFVAGYVGGRVDTVLMRFVDVTLSFPLLLLGVAAAAALRGRAVGVGPALVVLGLVSWPSIARVVRSRVRELRGESYVEASRALGERPLFIALRHVLPGLAGQLFVLAALSFPQMLLAESTLAFLGLGAPAPMPAWGRMLAEGQAQLRSAPWITVAPGAALLLVSLGFGLLGEGFRAAYEAEARR